MVVTNVERCLYTTRWRVVPGEQFTMAALYVFRAHADVAYSTALKAWVNHRS